jgi:hypothetical protein
MAIFMDSLDIELTASPFQLTNDMDDKPHFMPMYSVEQTEFNILSDDGIVTIKYIIPQQAPRYGSMLVDPRQYIETYDAVVKILTSHASPNMAPYQNMMSRGDGYQAPVELMVSVDCQPATYMALPAIHFRNTLKFSLSYHGATLDTLRNAQHVARRAVATLDQYKAAEYDRVEAARVRGGLVAAQAAFPRAAHMVTCGSDGQVGKYLEVNTAAGALQFAVGEQWGGKPLEQAINVMMAVDRRLAPSGGNDESKNDGESKDDGCFSDDEDEYSVPQTTSGKTWSF